MASRPRLVKRIRRKMWGGRFDMRIFDDGSMRVRVDHPSNDPAVEFAMAGEIASLTREKFAASGLPVPVIGPMTWRDDPEPPA